MADFDLQKLKRASTDDPSLQQTYLINQLRTGQHDPNSIIRCALDFTQPELQDRCARTLPRVLAMNPESITTLAVGMLDWWDNQASFPEEYPEGYNALDSVQLRLNEFVQRNPLAVRHLLDLLNNWTGEADRISWHANAYQMGERPESLAQNILSDFSMFANLGDFSGWDDIDYTLSWAHACGENADPQKITNLASSMWERIQNNNEFVHSRHDPDHVQQLAYLALNAIKDPSLRDDFIEQLDYYREREDLISVDNGDLEDELNLFADVFQAGNLLGLNPGTPYTDWSANPGLITRAIIRLNGAYRLPQIRNWIASALS